MYPRLCSYELCVWNPLLKMSSCFHSFYKAAVTFILIDGLTKEPLAYSQLSPTFKDANRHKSLFPVAYTNRLNVRIKPLSALFAQF